MTKIELKICSGTSCHLMGSFDLHQAIESIPEQYKENLEVSVISCLGKCGEGPNVSLDGTIYTQVTPEQLKNMVIKALKK